MSAGRIESSPVDEPVIRPISIDLLDAVLAIEVEAYTFPWTRGNFIDALAAGYIARALVAPGQQGRGHARRLLAYLYRQCATFGAAAVWLEVRESNARARALYISEGFAEAGRRRDYYPAPQGRHEDAILMTKVLGS